jgi:hypothetical protein
VPGLGDGRPREHLAYRPGCAEPTPRRAGQLYRASGLAGVLADGRPGRSGRDREVAPVRRAQLVGLAGLEPVARGPHLTHRSSTDRARQAVAGGLAAPIRPRTGRRSSGDVGLRPHRTRHRPTARPDDQLRRRAEQVLWCHANAARLARAGVGVVCADEVPTFRVLERTPTRRAVPGSSSRGSSTPRGTGR